MRVARDLKELPPETGAEVQPAAPLTISGALKQQQKPRKKSHSTERADAARKRINETQQND
jgi:hypothetical protein